MLLDDFPDVGHVRTQTFEARFASIHDELVELFGLIDKAASKGLFQIDVPVMSDRAEEFLKLKKFFVTRSSSMNCVAIMWQY